MAEKEVNEKMDQDIKEPASDDEINEETSAVSEETLETAEETEGSEETAEESPHVDEKEEEIETLKKQVEENENKYLKLYAEFENYKRRTRQEIDLNNKYKDQKMAENLLPVLDNFERALSIEGDSESFKALSKGVEMVYNDLVNTLMNHDVKEIKSTGEVFDPNYHQAVMTEASDGEPGIVIEEFQKGYMLKDRVIRPSMVKVSE